MKIQNNTGNVNGVDNQQIDRLDLKGKRDKSGLGGLGKASDFSDATRVDLSQRAQDMKKIKELAMAAPKDNTEKIARLQKLIDDGKYEIDSEAVADKMVDEHLIMEG